MRFPTYDDYEDEKGIIEELLSVRKCPVCGTLMKEESEVYDLGHRVEDRWLECPQCGYCQSL